MTTQARIEELAGLQYLLLKTFDVKTKDELPDRAFHVWTQIFLEIERIKQGEKPQIDRQELQQLYNKVLASDL